jgi:hypothetical protein
MVVSKSFNALATVLPAKPQTPVIRTFIRSSDTIWRSQKHEKRETPFKQNLTKQWPSHEDVAHRANVDRRNITRTRRFVVPADENVTAFLELESATRKNSIDTLCRLLPESRSRCNEIL